MLAGLLARADALKAELEGLRPMRPEDEQRLWQKLRLEWNYNSNHIEGNTLTYGETFLLLIHGQANGGHSMREFEEMKAHDVAVGMVREWAQDPARDLTEGDVRTLNKVLLKEPFWKEAQTAEGQESQIQVIPGKYKERPNNVRLPNGEIFQFASVEETPARMQELMAWYAETSDIHPVERAALFHHRFVLIHPFGDGNGRTARLVVNFILMRAGYMPLVVKSADKRNYLRALQQADAGDTGPLIAYLAEQEIWALELGIKAAKGEPVEEPSDWSKRAGLLFRNADADRKKEQTETTQWRNKVSRWIQVNFDELLSQTKNKVVTFEKFFNGNEFTLLIQADRLHGAYQPQFDRFTTTELLDLWNDKGLRTLGVSLRFGKYKFKGGVPGRNITFSLIFEPDQVRFHWHAPEKANETLTYDQLLMEHPLHGLDRAAAWIYKDIEKAQSS